ncbi:DsbA family protein [Motilimonas cestriensis]|uniref:DsbA family protein n=1 Tax=Motilimonas cestriensis TaxID=2742685 RepID=A0ABS8WA02_9GAMM|nr:DsbA family protein [Motilimonas cestriensis]MCE2595080.1 DsbA family protein [Motilimonas cestriensis]
MNKIIYIADPMCSWCFGFSAQLQQLKQQLPQYPFELVMGGLRTGEDAQPLDASLADMLSHHWQKVEQLTGQKINPEILNRVDQFIYDTEPACRAVTLLGEASPAHQFDYLLAVQTAFYQDNKDITQAKVLAELASPWLEQDFFLELFNSPAMIEATQQDFELSRQWQVFSYPTLVYSTEDRMILLAQGYATADAIREGIENIEQGLADEKTDSEAE